MGASTLVALSAKIGLLHPTCRGPATLLRYIIAGGPPFFLLLLLQSYVSSGLC